MTCDLGHGDLIQHISLASVRSLGQHVGSERYRDTLSTSDKSKVILIWKQNTQILIRHQLLIISDIDIGIIVLEREGRDNYSCRYSQNI